MNEEYEEILNKMFKDVSKEKGGSITKYRNLLGKIAYMESKGDHKAIQKGGGPGRGKYQFEGKGSKNASNRILTSAVRTNRYFRSKGMDTPDFVLDIMKKGTGDASLLDEKAQDILALGDLRMGPANIKKFAKGELKDKDIYLDNWWAGKDKKHRDSLSSKWDNEDSFFKNTKLYDNSEDVDILKDNMTGNYQEKDNYTYSKEGPTMPSENIKNMSFNSQMKAPESLEMEKSIENENIQKRDSLDLKEYMNRKAQGGYLNDKFNEFKGGGTHEQNPLGGIPQGTGSNGKPNTVEEDETSYDFPEGKFIFSNRIKT